MGQAVSTVLRKYADFTGRARRSEYWWYALAYVIVLVVVLVVSAAIGSMAPYYLVLLALFLPTLAVLVRRLHDTGRSGWFALIGLIPFIGGIVLLVFACQDSQPAGNQHGPSPKALAGGPAYGQGYGQPHYPA